MKRLISFSGFLWNKYIFLNIRAKSVGEISKLRILCPDDGKTYAQIELDLTKVEVQVGDDHTNKIELTDDKLNASKKMNEIMFKIIPEYILF